jgi:hypothetical protein
VRFAKESGAIAKAVEGPDPAVRHVSPVYMKAAKARTQGPAQREALLYVVRNARVIPTPKAEWGIPLCMSVGASTGELELAQRHACPENGGRRYQTE